MKGPTADELEISNLQSDISRMKANNTALAESLASKSDLISELNSRIAGFEEDSVKRRQSLAALKSGVDDLTLEVESKKERVSVTGKERGHCA
jgi:predicted RNase H-like nuclease (RuvC/YqgF family)